MSLAYDDARWCYRNLTLRSLRDAWPFADPADRDTLEVIESRDGRLYDRPYTIDDLLEWGEKYATRVLR